MKLRRSALRTLTTLALSLGLGLAAAACDKGGAGTDDPNKADEPGKGDGKAAAEGGKDYVYAEQGFTLTATMDIKIELSTSEGAGTATLAAKSLIEAKPTADGKLEIHGKVLELTNFTGTGQMEPEFLAKQAAENGQPAMDIVADLKAAEDWLVIDRKGELDEAATKALPQKKDAKDSQDFGLFNLPNLPEIDLVEGEKIKLPTREDERVLPFGSIPVEVDETWTLRKIDADRIAEFDVVSEVSGATELSGEGGSAMVSTMEESSFTVRFNLETQVPVSISGYSANETSIDAQGQNFSFSTNSEIKGTYAAP